MAPTALGATVRAQARRRRELRKVVVGLLFIAPWAIGFLWLTVYPMLASLFYSFTDYPLLGAPKWAGLANFQEMFFRDKLYWVSVRNTLYYALVSVPLYTVFGIGLALLLNRRVSGMSIYRTLYYVPTVVPGVASVMLWAWILNPQVGLVNSLLGMIGIRGPGWLSDPYWAKPSLILLGMWGAGGSTVIYLAGLQDIPAHLYEAASLDGANPLQKSWFVTLPLLTPTILFNLVMGLIAAFQYFTQAFVAGAFEGPLGVFGGPLNALLFYNLYLYRNAFSYFRMGYASAMAWVLLVFVLALTLGIFRTTGRWVHYGR
ncbi:MAG: sugar ABC transporter permease [Anaerolineae bacterium]|nr:sugar ABC transporter permease [Anaerolineae bacterium]